MNMRAVSGMPSSSSSSSSSVPSLQSLRRRISRRRKPCTVSLFKVNAQAPSYEDGYCEKEKSSKDIIEREMCILRERIEVVRKRERLLKWHTNRNGWDYLLHYDESLRRKKERPHFLETAAELMMAAQPVTLTSPLTFIIISLTLALCLASVSHLA